MRTASPSPRHRAIAGATVLGLLGSAERTAAATLPQLNPPDRARLVSRDSPRSSRPGVDAQSSPRFLKHAPRRLDRPTDRLLRGLREQAETDSILAALADSTEAEMQNEKMTPDDWRDVRAVIVPALCAWMLLIASAGCVSVQTPSGWKYNSCAKDIAVHAKLPDGSEVDITSNVNSEALKAVAEGAARGAASGLKP